MFAHEFRRDGNIVDQNFPYRRTAPVENQIFLCRTKFEIDAQNAGDVVRSFRDPQLHGVTDIAIVFRAPLGEFERNAGFEGRACGGGHGQLQDSGKQNGAHRRKSSAYHIASWSKMPERFDAIVIGAGQAGPPLCARLDQQGLKTAIIERKLLGGTCVNVGCILTKTLAGSARAIHMARRGAEYGFAAGDVRVDMKAVKARKDGVVKHSTDGLASWIGGMKNVTLVRGQARFTAPRTLDVGGRALAADKVFINVGGRAAVPDIPGVKDVPYLTNSSIMEVDQVPEHLVIVGGSYIGLEFAQMYRRFGARITVVEAFDKLLPREDDDVVAEIRAILEREGIEVVLGAKDLKLKKSGAQIRVEFAGKSIEGSHLLLAVGRLPNTHDLGLKEAGIAADARGF